MNTTTSAARRSYLRAAGSGLAATLIGPPTAAAGAGMAPANAVEWLEADGLRLVRGNGMPDHDNVGPFPGFADPHPLAARPIAFRMALRPQAAAQPTPIAMWRFGVALNGVPFDPAGPWWRGDVASGWQLEVMSERVRHYIGLDASNGHTQPGGGYHYHGMPERYVKQLARVRLETFLRDGEFRPGADGPLLLGYAADGFPVYRPFVRDEAAGPDAFARELKPSYRVKRGLRPAGAPLGSYDGTFVQDYEYVAGLGDLDECNGLWMRTPEYPQGTYAYVLTAAFPHVPRQWRGRPDPSFRVGNEGAEELPPQFRQWPARA